MCCFSRPVLSVSGTNIFARSGVQGRQYLVYSMHLSAKEDLAMILPIPVKPHSGEKAVRFINLEGYPDFFRDMEKGFIVPSRGMMQGMKSGAMPMAGAKLAVVSVGSFEASFVPTVHDFARLDERFRLPAGTWDKLPQYKTYGFAVFKLKAGAKTVHPMAFDFPRADPARLFFPTVHIHDGKIHQSAHFDHALFCQKMPTDTFSMLQWQESNSLARDFLTVGKTKNIVTPGSHCYKHPIIGVQKNTDIVL